MHYNNNNNEKHFVWGSLLLFTDLEAGNRWIVLFYFAINVIDEMLSAIEKTHLQYWDFEANSSIPIKQWTSWIYTLLRKNISIKDCTYYVLFDETNY